MSTMITEVYEAFISAGAPEDKAKAAARAVAEYDSRFNRVDSDLALVKAEMVVLKWMLGFVLAGVVSLVMKSFFA
ncbi:MAG: integrase [Pseudomonadota bacterium]|nr:integrase [Pseudomonadota bacterium]